jgi:hypothetical protein
MNNMKHETYTAKLKMLTVKNETLHKFWLQVRSAKHLLKIMFIYFLFPSQIIKYMS